MNERIKELAEQAKEYASSYVAECKHYGYYMDHNEFDVRFEGKFAELIIKECARTVNDTEYPYEDKSHKDTWDACCVWSAEKLKEQFGVE